jgi:hypothetical protein
MNDQTRPKLYYSRSFQTWLGTSILLIPLTSQRHRPVLDTFMWPLIEYYDNFQVENETLKYPMGTVDAEGLI